MQAAESGFLRKISGLTFLDEVKSEDIRESFNIESLLLGLEKSQMLCYEHVTQMPQEETEIYVIWNFIKASVTCGTRSRRLKALTRAAAPTNPKGKADLKKMMMNDVTVQFAFCGSVLGMDKY